MTRGTMRELLRRRIMETTADHWSDTNLNDMLEVGLQEMQTYIMALDPDAFVFVYQRDIVNGSDLYEWPVGMDYEYQVRIKNTATTKYDRVTQLDSWRAIDANESASRADTFQYARLGQHLQLTPVPDTDIANGLRIYFHPTLSMADDNVVPLIKVRLHYAVVLSAAKHLLPQAGSEFKQVDEELAPYINMLPLWYRTSAAPKHVSLDIDRGY